MYLCFNKYESNALIFSIEKITTENRFRTYGYTYARRDSGDAKYGAARGGGRECIKKNGGRFHESHLPSKTFGCYKTSQTPKYINKDE